MSLDDRITNLEQRVDNRIGQLERRMDDGFQHVTDRLDTFIDASNRRCENHLKTTYDQFTAILKKIDSSGKTANKGLAELVGAPWFKIFVGVVVSAILGYLGYDITTGQ